MNPSSFVAVYDVSPFALVILIVKPGSKKSYLFTIHKLSGSLDFSGIQNHSIFSSQLKAEQFIKKIYGTPSPSITGIALVGYAHTGSNISIIIITEAVPVAYFMNKHIIFQIKSAKDKTFEIPLFPTDDLDPDHRNISKVDDFPLAELHMWCETKDLTSPIGFEGKQKDDFIWNNYLASPFSSYGHRDACVTLLEGTAMSQILVIGIFPRRVTIITVRSSAHAGTRYHARGLNTDAHPANEVQCELIIESSTGEIMSHFWRRGTVPVQWRTVQSKALPTASLEVENNCSELTPIYFNRLREEYNSNKIVCVNLLHNNENNPEFKLCTAYKNAVSYEKNVSYFEFDWHHNKKEIGLEKCVELYWENIFNFIDKPSFTISKIEKTVKPCSRIIKNSFLFENDEKLKKLPIRVISRQNSFVRVNCMDSLDRTNVGCFFFCVFSILHSLQRVEKVPKYSQLKSLEEDLRVFLANAFIAIGDTVSLLYTNTPACMTSTFSKCAGIENKTASDSSIAMQRRYQNFVKDKTRQKAIDTFLGIRFERHSDLFCVSSYPATFLHPLPGNISAEKNNLHSLLSYKRSSLTFKVTTKIAQSIIYLAHPTYLHSIVINSVPPHQPIFVSIEAGMLLSDIHKISSNFALPKTVQETQFIIRIPPDYSNGNEILSRIIRLSFFTNDTQITLSNIFVFGTIQPEKPAFIIQNRIYEDLSCYQFDNKWPRIADTSSLRSVVSNIKDATIETAINIELARLHHQHSKLEAATAISVNGYDPFEFTLNRFKGSLSANPPFVSLPSNIICSCCGLQFLTQYHSVYDEFFFTEDEMVYLCPYCNEKYQCLKSSLINLKRFYHQFWRLHEPIENENSQFFLEYNLLSTNYAAFPSTSLILCDNPQSNMILTDEGGSVSAPSHFQVCFGSRSIINSITLIGDEKCTVILQSNLSSKHISCKCGTTIIGIVDQLIALLITEGTVNKITFDIQSDSFSLNNDKDDGKICEPVSWKMKESIISKKSVASNELVVVFKMNKQTVLNGLTFEKMTGINAIIILFYDSSHLNEKASNFESCFLPIGAHDFSLYFQNKKTAQAVKVIFYDTAKTFQLSKIGIF